MENKMEEAATNLSAASSLTGEAEPLTGTSENNSADKKRKMDSEMDEERHEKEPEDVSAHASDKEQESKKKETVRKTDDGTYGKELENVPGRSRAQTMAPEWRMEQPVCLIESDDKGALRVNPQAVKILEAIAQPVVVVAVVGPYCTGKSYLMNALAGQRKGFSLGSTVQSHTKGIWMWCLPHPRRAGHTLVLLDTEGLGDVHKGDPKYDTWIFTLAVLLSSTLVYNSKGTIDQDAMSKLHYVSELSQHIKVKADVTKEEEETAADTEYVSFFPSFIWTLRDFTLELKGKRVSEDEYLESTLMLKKGAGRGKKVFKYNLPRECIREYFPTRKCFVFVRPGGSNRDMRKLESLPDSALQPEFLEQSRRFCQYVLQESRVKMLKGGHPVTGQMLGLLAQSYVEIIMSGKVPCLEDAVTSVAITQNEAAVRSGLAHYVAQMEEQVTFPAEVAALSETHGACERAALQLFMQQSFKDEGQKYQEQLAEAINEHYSAVQSRNRTASQETCRALLSQLSTDMEKKLSEGVYMQPGGYRVYVTDQRQVLQSFQRIPNKGVMVEQVLQQFMGSKKAEAAAILLADKMLSGVEKHQAADQARLEQLEQQRKAEEERRQQLEQQRRDLERSHQENISQVETKMKEEAEKLRQEMERALQCKLKEQEKLLEQGFTEKSELMKEEMEQLQKEAKEREEKPQWEFLERVKLMKEQMEEMRKEAKEQEEKLQQELAEPVPEQLTENKMEEVATNLTAACSLTGEAERRTGRSRPQTMAPEWRMEQPVCLIESDDKGALRVNPQAVKILKAIAQPVVVVAVVGLYRTGKSYLMNALAGERKGFSLGSTIQSHTKGIWMWCVPHPHQASHTLVLLDTEGLGDVEKGDPNHDAWIFTLAVLLSSTLVYNSKGTIDQDAMSKLHFVSELSEHIKVKTDVTKEQEEETAADTEYVSFFPSFIWTVRDFTLDLELDGKQVTEDEYLERALMLKKGRSIDVLNYNAPRQCIREYFPTRKCFVFVRPASHERDMRKLESLPESTLQPEFLEQSRRFCQYVLQESRVKMLKGGHPVTGHMFGLLAQSYVETILSGKVPCLEDAVTTIVNMQNEAAVREGLALYDAQMKEQVTFPAEVATLSETHGACERAALQLFMQQSFKDEGQKYQEQLATAINEHYSAVLGRNRTVSQETCWALLSQLSAVVGRKLSEGVYMQPGGYQLYVTDQRQVLESFQRTPNKGARAEQVLQQFMDSKRTEAASILRADKMLSEVEKTRAADQARLEQLEQQRKAEEERRQQLEQQMRDLEHSHQENIRQLETKMKEEAEKLRQETERAVQSKLREQEKLLQQGFKEKAELLQEEMEQLQKEAKQWEEKLQQEYLKGDKLRKKEMNQLQKEAKEQEEKLQQELLERDKLMKEQMDRLQEAAKEREEKLQKEFLERDKLRKKEMNQLQKEAKEQEEKLQQELLERDKLLKEEMDRRLKEAKEQEEKQQQEFLEREKLLKEEMDRPQKEAKEREEKRQQEFLKRDKLMKEQMEQLKKEAKEREEKQQQEFLEREKLLKEEMDRRQKEAKERNEKKQQELLQRQMRAEEEHKERQHQQEREQKERQRQEEERQRKQEEKERQRQEKECQRKQEEKERQRQEKECQRKQEEKERQRQEKREEEERKRQEKREEEERKRQWEREEKERQRQEEERQREREEKERQRQEKREEEERKRQWEREEKERQCQHDEKEKQRKHEIEMEKLKNQRWCTQS